MENISLTELFNLLNLKNNIAIKNFIQKLNSQSAATLGYKIVEPATSFVIFNSFFYSSHNCHLIIESSREKAEERFFELNYVCKDNIFLFLAEEKPIVNEKKAIFSQNLKMQIVFAISKAIDQEKVIVISTKEIFEEKFYNPNEILKNSFSLSVSDSFVFGDFVDKLQKLKFKQTDEVYYPGGYSIRGKIIDIFPYVSEVPYRIELSENQIGEIRSFSVQTQLSIEQKKHIDIFGVFDEERNANCRLLEIIPDKTIVWNSENVNCENLYLQNNDDFQIVNAKKLKNINIGDKGDLCFNFQIQKKFRQNLQEFQHELLENSKNRIFSIIVWATHDELELIEKSLSQATKNLKDLFFVNFYYQEGFQCEQLSFSLYTVHDIFDRFNRSKKIKSSDVHVGLQKSILKDLNQLSIGDFVVHEDYGIGKFCGLAKKPLSNVEVIRLLYGNESIVYLGLQALQKISKYECKELTEPQLSVLGTKSWENKKKKISEKVKKLAYDLISLYSERKKAKGFVYSSDNEEQKRMEEAFIYSPTEDQLLAISDIKKDMQSPYPMDRLICGDVGFGKTEVAMRAAYKAVLDNKQVVVLVPTTILALQHYNSFSNRLSSFGVKIDFVSRFKTKKEVDSVMVGLVDGSIDIVVGTHKLLNDKIKFKDLGLLIIDEEQKFGVGSKDKLKQMKIDVDILTLTATPIPRTLHFSLMGARDLSIIATPPKNRQPIETCICESNDQIIKKAISFELNRGGQVIFLHNKIEDILLLEKQIKELFPSIRIAVVHSKILASKLENNIISFINNKFDLLLTTSIIEAGVDFQNANTLIVNDSQNFGLCDLHQLRGRVGRSNRKAYCYLLIPNVNKLTSVAKKRLVAMEDFSDLGDGYNIAMRDLDLRGAGDIIGRDQSGFIADVGFKTYCNLLEKTVCSLKTNEFKDVFATRNSNYNETCFLDIDIDAYIPDDYIFNENERLNFYSQLAIANTEENLKSISDELKDRYGPIPDTVVFLIKMTRLRWVAGNKGISELKFSKDQLQCLFYNTNIFRSQYLEKCIDFVNQNQHICSIENTPKSLTIKINKIKNILDIENIINKL